MLFKLNTKFRFSKDQTVRSLEDLPHGQVKKGTRGRVVTHRAEVGGNFYLVKFVGAEHYVQCEENQLERS